jgi:lipopolysaccharide/colanic/teichoic acid biosynthesis glycosyltransferase
MADLLVVQTGSQGTWYRNHGKRIVDVLVAAFAIATVSPVLAAVALGIRLSLGSPVLFRQNRPGKMERPFVILKFRTMLEVFDENGTLLADSKRLTRFGSFLRRFGLDELPQLVNVVIGDMSLVGPRPLLMEHLRHFTPDERARFEVRPGITGLAQIAGRNLVPWDERFRLDCHYVQNLRIGLDFRILLRTVFLLIGCKGVVADPESAMRNLEEERATFDRAQTDAHG